MDQCGWPFWLIVSFSSYLITGKRLSSRCSDLGRFQPAADVVTQFLMMTTRWCPYLLAQGQCDSSIELICKLIFLVSYLVSCTVTILEPEPNSNYWLSSFGMSCIQLWLFRYVNFDFCCCSLSFWGRYVVLPRPVCFEKGVNYTVRLELPQYTSDSSVESPYTLIDSVSARSVLTCAGKAGWKVFLCFPREFCGGLTLRS